MNIERLHLLVCTIFQTEASEVIRTRHWDNVELDLFPQFCNQPHFQAHLSQKLARFDELKQDYILIGGNCVDVIKPHLPPAINGCIHCSQQCYTLFTGHTLADYLTQQGAYLLTPGWLETWPQQIQTWGFDQLGAQEFFHESIKKLLLLDTTLMPASPVLLKALGEYTQLPTEMIPVGLEHFELILSGYIQDWNHKKTQKILRGVETKYFRSLADNAMTFDLLSQLTRTFLETEAIHEVLTIFEMLLSPGSIVFCQTLNERKCQPTPCKLSAADCRDFKQWIEHKDEPYSMLPDNDGFYLRLIHQEQTIGALRLEHFRFPEYLQHYLSISLSIAPVCGLAIANARVYQKLQESETLAQQQKQGLSTLYEQVKEYAGELEISLKEQEAFSYSISHDLRTPLRAIGSYATILKQEYAAGLDGEAQHLLGRINANVAHMSHLIDDLLTLSLVGRKSIKSKPVSPAEIVQSVLHCLKPELINRRVHFSIGQMPVCRSDPNLLEQLFKNLISNALKYTRTSQNAEIEIGFLSAGELPPTTTPSLPPGSPGAYYVKDNGIGFEMQYVSKIFGLFQRLHRSSEYEGTGMGLAIAQRIITRHKGVIWAEGEPDRGATFYFAFPE